MGNLDFLTKDFHTKNVYNIDSRFDRHLFARHDGHGLRQVRRLLLVQDVHRNGQISRDDLHYFETRCQQQERR